MRLFLLVLIRWNIKFFRKLKHKYKIIQMLSALLIIWLKSLLIILRRYNNKCIWDILNDTRHMSLISKLYNYYNIQQNLYVHYITRLWEYHMYVHFMIALYLYVCTHLYLRQWFLKCYCKHIEKDSFSNNFQAHLMMMFNLLFEMHILHECTMHI